MSVHLLLNRIKFILVWWFLAHLPATSLAATLPCGYKAFRIHLGTFGYFEVVVGAYHIWVTVQQEFFNFLIGWFCSDFFFLSEIVRCFSVKP